MRIGIDLTWRGAQVAGVGTMTDEVVAALQRREGIDVVLFSVDGKTIRSGWRRHLDLCRAIRAAQVDVLWQVGDWLPLLLPGGVKTIQTVHDLIAFDHPEWFPQRGLSRWWSRYVRVGRSVRRATVVHAVSNWTRDAVVRHFPRVGERCIVAYEGVSVPEQGSNSRRIEEPYLLVLGTIEPRKNIPTICEAFAQFVEEHARGSIVFAGKSGWHAGASLKAIEGLSVRYPKRVHRLGYVSDEEKWSLLRHAGALILFSQEEGFGRPIVEAMRVETPVIAAATSAMEEIADEAAIMIFPTDTKKLARAMWRVLYHPVLPDRLRALGRARAERFTVDGMVDKVLHATKQKIT